MTLECYLYSDVEFLVTVGKGAEYKDGSEKGTFSSFSPFLPSLLEQREIKLRAFKMGFFHPFRNRGKKLRVSREDAECCLPLRVSI